VSERKHTPGPWYVGKSGGDRNTVICTDEKKPSRTAVAFTVNRVETRNQCAAIRLCEANACLLAAAPDMFEELERSNALLTKALKYLAINYKRKELQRRINGQINGNYRALAKAKGVIK